MWFMEDSGQVFSGRVQILKHINLIVKQGINMYRHTFHVGFVRNGSMQPGPSCFNDGLALSAGWITIQWISYSEINCAIQWIVIYPMDSVIHLLNSWGQVKTNQIWESTCAKLVSTKKWHFFFCLIRFRTVWGWFNIGMTVLFSSPT